LLCILILRTAGSARVTQVLVMVPQVHGVSR